MAASTRERSASSPAMRARASGRPSKRPMKASLRKRRAPASTRAGPCADPAASRLLASMLF